MTFNSEKKQTRKTSDYKHIKQHFGNGCWAIVTTLIVTELCILNSNFFLTQLWPFTSTTLRILKALPLLEGFKKAAESTSTFTLWGWTSPPTLSTVNKTAAFSVMVQSWSHLPWAQNCTQMSSGYTCLGIGQNSALERPFQIHEVSVCLSHYHPITVMIWSTITLIPSLLQPPELWMAF